MSPSALELVQSLFDPLIGTKFRIVLGDGQAASVELVESTALPPPTGGVDLPVRRDPFSLVFTGEPTLALEQPIYPLEHAQLGALELFLVPIGPGQYEAVCN